MNRLITGTSAAALVIAASLGVAHAQSSDASETNNQTAASGTSSGSSQREASDITCSELTAMDTATVPGVLYFISGYSAGQQNRTGGSSTMSSSGTDASAATDSTASGSGSGTTTESGSSTSADAGGSASDSSTSSGSGSTETTASSGGGTDSDTTASTRGDDAASGSANPQVQISAMRGYFEIPVEQALIACREAPESRASDMLNQQMGGSNNSNDSSAQ